jgi:disulfide oxidoreductase YuzD
MNKEAISLGWGCYSAIYGKNTNIRSSKKDGYLTCPFDIMVSNYEGIIDCINDNFDKLCDEKYLKVEKISDSLILYNKNELIGENMIINTKYNFIFNHESPGHANLYIKEKWSKGINHYILNNFEEFKIRYNKRIENIKYYLNSDNFITFIINRPYTTNISDIQILDDTIKKKYPNLQYEYKFLNINNRIEINSVYDHLLLMNISKDNQEITRLCNENEIIS